MKLGLLKNKKGISIIQVLVAAGMTSIVSLGVVQMIENSRRMQRRTTLVSTLSDIRSRLENNMRDQIAFNNTVNGNTTPPFSQMDAAIDVTENGLSSPVQFRLYDASNNSLNLLGLASADSTGTRYNGFTERGGLCNDFNPIVGYGTDQCPISYRLLVSADCPRGTETSCRDPNLVMVARLVFNPASTSSSTMNTWRGLIPQVSGSSLIDPPEKYDAEVKRSASKINRSFYISASVSPAGAPADCYSAAVTNTGGGTCSTGGFVTHPLQITRADAPGWQEESDPHDMVIVNPAAGTFSVSPTGMYRCTGMAKAFGNNTTIELYNSSTSTSIGTGTAVLGQYTEGEARLDLSFTVTSTGHAYTLRQQCGTTNPTMRSCGLGFAPEGYSDGGRKLITLTCDRMDVMF